MMKLTKQQLKKIKNFAKKQIKKNDAWHNLSHIQRTIKIAVDLAKKEKADIKKCVVATWLHDIAKNGKNEDHGNEGARIAKKFLQKIGLERQDIDDVVYIIQQHNKSNKKIIKEAEIIWDADKLQSAGIFGLLRLYGFLVLIEKDPVKAYKKYHKEIIFYKNKFYTKTAKAIIKEKKRLMIPLFEIYKKEAKGNFFSK